VTFRVGSFLIVESIAEDRQGRDVLSGLLTRLVAGTTTPVSVFAEFFPSAGSNQRVNIGVRVIGPDGATTELCRDLGVVLASTEPSVRVVLRGRLETRKRGLHEIQLLVDGRAVADRPLVATDPPAGPAGA
jgi:hypothetical protein